MEKLRKKYSETTIMKSDSGKEHGRGRIGIFWFWWYGREFGRLISATAI